MKTILFCLTLLMFVSLDSKAQDCQNPCPYYNDFINLAQAKTVKNTQTKLNYYRAAIVAAKDCNCPELERNANEQIDTLFVIIEEEKRTAELQAQTILEQQDKIEVALEDTKKAKVNNEKIISALDFYKGKFALASKGEKYGFINKVGDTEIEFTYDKGEPFNQETGFAEMERGDSKYLLNIDKKEYKLVRISEVLKNIDNIDAAIYKEEAKWFESIANKELNVATLLEKEVLVHERNIKRDSIALGKEIDDKVKAYWINQLKTEQEALTLTRNELQKYKKNKTTEIGNRLNELRVKLEVVEENQKVANDRLFKVLKDGNEPLALDFSREYNLDIISILEQIANDQFISNKVELLFLNNVILDRVPSFLSNFKNLKELNFKNTKIKVLPESFKELTQLVRLDLSYTLLSKLPKDIGDLTALKYLNLDATYLKTLPTSFSKLKNLEVLNIQATRMTTILESVLELISLKELYPPQSIKNVPVKISRLKNLKILDLKFSNIKNLPESIGQLQNLKYFFAPKKLEELPASISNLTNLEILDLSSTELKILRESIGNLTKLKRLNLPSKLMILPESIGNLTSLRNLDLSHKLKDLPASFFKLKNLESLNLYYINLTELPESIGKLTNLNYLNCPKNLKKLPVDILNLKNLESLNLTYTQIESIPEFIGELQNLKELRLPTHLKELPLSIFDLKKLEVLHLNMKELETVPSEIGKLLNLMELYVPSQVNQLPKSFIQLKKLEKLYLNNTKIKALPEGFKHLTELKILILENSTIDTLSEEICELRQLTELNLKNTKIKRLPQNIGKLTNLTSLYLENTIIKELPVSINQLINLDYLNLKGNSNLKDFPDMSTLKKLRTFDFTLYKGENYSAIKTKLEKLKEQLPNCYFIIRNEKGELLPFNK